MPVLGILSVFLDLAINVFADVLPDIAGGGTVFIGSINFWPGFLPV